MTTSALIGYTGFVGSTLLQTDNYDALYNSSNITKIRGRQFSSVVCAGVSAVKWLANKEPEADRQAIDSLKQNIREISTDHFILISTIDVYSNPVGVTEEDSPDLSQAQPYGRHRRELELWAEAQFPKTTIIRLPGLFGHGLKKNLIYDLLKGSGTENISPNGVLQWYPMHRFSKDLAKVAASQYRLVNISPEPIPTKDIHSSFFERSTIGANSLPGPRYDMQTRYPELLDGTDRYHITRQQVLADLAKFTAEPRL
ncbi:NAD-dependent epimerase/dehydratase family protein [Xaviernesmea oryzae]|uniref:hypothetical protein n=1 Tax=Xaviernesmea oryzae TaxID=464029 RepID=UPI0008AEEB33|nr:hypothetical protein [Xaviernesmea oryzae]SEK95956.1 Nucleoside-diphosphate-sugar epimerase [Xaviernesmea oryzae]